MGALPQCKQNIKFLERGLSLTYFNSILIVNEGSKSKWYISRASQLVIRIHIHNTTFSSKLIIGSSKLECFLILGWRGLLGTNTHLKVTKKIKCLWIWSLNIRVIIKPDNAWYVILLFLAKTTKIKWASQRNIKKLSLTNEMVKHSLMQFS